MKQKFNSIVHQLTTRDFIGSISVVETTVKRWSKTLTLLLVMLMSVNVLGI